MPRNNLVCLALYLTNPEDLHGSDQYRRPYNAIREAKAKGRDLPPPFANEDIEAMTPIELWRKYTVNSPLGREQTAEDMGRAVVFFVSEDAKNITGQTLHVDGGATMR